jgi:hypothetical protein
MIDKRELEEAKASLRHKKRELEDIEESNLITIRGYQSKLKHLLKEFSDELTSNKVGIELEDHQIQAAEDLMTSMLKGDRIDSIESSNEVKRAN